MTQLRKQKDAISNEMDRILEGVGHRGSTFTDIDAMSHDMRTHRFLFMEFKRPNESMTSGQRMALCDLALEERMTVWYVQLWPNGDYGQIAWADMRWPDSIDFISVEEFRARYRSWWENKYELGRHAEIDQDISTRSSTRRTA